MNENSNNILIFDAMTGVKKLSYFMPTIILLNFNL